MINKPNNWNNVQAFSDRQKLPLGAYVCTIKRAAVQRNDYGDQLCVLFDISAGEFAGYYDEDFKRNQREDKKWKGVLRLWLPKEDGSDKDEWTKSILKGFIAGVVSTRIIYLLEVVDIDEYHIQEIVRVVVASCRHEIVI